MPVERTDTSVDAGPAPIDLTESALSGQYRQAVIIRSLRELLTALFDLKGYARHRTDCLERSRTHPITHKCVCGFYEASMILEEKIGATLKAIDRAAAQRYDGGISP